MSEHSVISEKQFREALEEKLGENTDRAVQILNRYGKLLSYDVFNVMLHGVDQHKELEILDLLEEHWQKQLQWLHPDIRGRIETAGVNQTEEFFKNICTKTLELRPTRAY